MFSRIIAYKKSTDLVFLWCKLFLFLLPRSWLFLLLLPRAPKIFLDLFPRSWKILQILANLAKINCQDLSKKSQKSKNIFSKKSKIFLVLSSISWIVLVSLPRSRKLFLDSFPHDLEESCKILRNLPRIIAKILARNVKNPRNFLERKPSRQALGILVSPVRTGKISEKEATYFQMLLSPRIIVTAVIGFRFLKTY